MSPRIERITSRELPATIARELRELCAAAYDEDFSHYFDDVGPGVHLLGWEDGSLVSHAMWVSRTMYVKGAAPLAGAYIEAVATRVGSQGRGHATSLMRRIAKEIVDFDLGALSPTRPEFYGRLGWEPWRGPLAIRTIDGVVETPDESVMVLRLPRTPDNLNTRAELSVDWRPGEIW